MPIEVSGIGPEWETSRNRDNTAHLRDDAGNRVGKRKAQVVERLTRQDPYDEIEFEKGQLRFRVSGDDEDTGARILFVDSSVVLKISEGTRDPVTKHAVVDATIGMGGRARLVIEGETIAEIRHLYVRNTRDEVADIRPIQPKKRLLDFFRLPRPGR